MRDMHNKTGRPRKYYFDKMKVGESMFLPSEIDNKVQWQRRISQLSRAQVKKTGCFTVNQKWEGDVFGVTVTRVAL